MRPVLKSIPKAYVALLGVFVGLVLLAPADAADDAAKGTVRGGLQVEAEGHRFEVFFFPTGLRLFPQDASGKTLDASTVSAVAIFYHPNSPQAWFSRDLRVSAVPLGERPTGLELGLDLSAVPTSGASVAFEVGGLEDHVITFTVPFTLAGGTAPASPVVAAAASAPFVYAVGAQGVGYYANPGPQAAPVAAAPRQAVAPTTARAASVSSSRSVGPGVRDWSTGRRGRLHKPWLNSR